jgi:hypothetical protein
MVCFYETDALPTALRRQIHCLFLCYRSGDRKLLWSESDSSTSYGCQCVYVFVCVYCIFVCVFLGDAPGFGNKRKQLSFN